MAGSNNTLRNLQAKLDRQAIDQLRKEVTSLQGRLEAAELRATEAEARLEAAWDSADAWHDHAFELMEHMNEQGRAPQVGITQQGQLLVMPLSEKNH